MLRNPLHEPRLDSTEMASLQEGRQVAQAIRQLLASGATKEENGAVSQLGYGDILVLLRQRTQAAVFEQALREAGIPCLGASRGLLLENLEVRDLVALLEILVTPFDNLALAQVLRSPLFGLDSEQLLPLAEHDGTHWYARLRQLAGTGHAPYRDIHTLLSGWRTLAGQLPVHDLLDRIFHEGEVLQRYQAAFPDLLHPRMRASFTRFLELALELDNGRYPSLPRFLDQLHGLRASDRDQPDESAPEASPDGRVQLMTVHAAKGLERTVVFLVDAARTTLEKNAWQGCVDWPPDAPRPRLMLLAATSALRDSHTGELLAGQSAAAETEEANLLYVALTRARQYLFVSGNAKASAGNLGWYGSLAAALEDAPRNDAGNPQLESNQPRPADVAQRAAVSRPVVSAQLSQPVITKPRDVEIAPSRLATDGEPAHADGDGRTRGLALHRMLERLTSTAINPDENLSIDLANQLQRDPDDPELRRWWHEARTLVADPRFAFVFDPARYRRAYNEVPVQYQDGARMVYGVIDRLVVNPDHVLVIDYKTHRNVQPEDLTRLLAQYRPQLQCYATAAQRLWPDRPVRAGLLFTARAELCWMDAVQ